MIRIAIFSVAIMAILLTSVTALTALTTTANNNDNNLNLAFAQTQVGEAILLLSMPKILILFRAKGQLSSLASDTLAATASNNASEMWVLGGSKSLFCIFCALRISV
jgi:hypothetical protein